MYKETMFRSMFGMKARIRNRAITANPVVHNQNGVNRIITKIMETTKEKIA